MKNEMTQPKYLFLMIVFLLSFFTLIEVQEFTPIIMFERKGCGGENMCQGAAYASPSHVVVSGRHYIAGSTHESFYVIDALTGEEIARAPTYEPFETGNIGRTFASLAVYEEGGSYYVVSGHEQDDAIVCKWELLTLNQVWCHRIETEASHGGHSSSGMIRSLTVGKIRAGSGDDNMYIIPGVCCNSRTVDLIYVLRPDGSLLFSAPSDTDPGDCHSIGNDNVALYDINNDGNLEIFVPCDNSKVYACDSTGTPLSISDDFSEICCDICPTPTGMVWGCSYNWNEFWVERKGWPDPDEEDVSLRRTNHHFNAVSPFTFKGEVYIARTALIGGTFDPSWDFDTAHFGMFISKADKTRGLIDDNPEFDWSSIVEVGGPLSGCFDCSESFWCMPNIVVYDLDGDGNPEFLWSAPDGYLHMFWLSQEEKYNWPFRLGGVGSDYRFGSEPVAFYCDDTNTAITGTVIVVASWERRSNAAPGYLHFINAVGDEITRITLPQGSTSRSDGSLPAPTLYKVDGDGNSTIRVSLQMKYAGNVGINLLGTENCGIIWPTARGSSFHDGYTRSDIVVGENLPVPKVDYSPYIALAVGGLSAVLFIVVLFCVVAGIVVFTFLINLRK